jgi:hypothetical protein
VSRRAWASTLPSGSTTPPSSFVPPMSIPMVSPTAPVLPSLPLTFIVASGQPAVVAACQGSSG